MRLTTIPAQVLCIFYTLITIDVYLLPRAGPEPPDAWVYMPNAAPLTCQCLVRPFSKVVSHMPKTYVLDHMSNTAFSSPPVFRFLRERRMPSTICNCLNWPHRWASRATTQTSYSPGNMPLKNNISFTFHYLNFHRLTRMIRDFGRGCTRMSAPLSHYYNWHCSDIAGNYNPQTFRTVGLKLKAVLEQPSLFQLGLMISFWSKSFLDCSCNGLKMRCLMF